LNSKANQIPAFINKWFDEIQSVGTHEAIPDPSRAAVFSSDVITGFLTSGNLASERVGKLAKPISDFFEKTYWHGIRDFVLLQDAHHENAPEFKAFPPHCRAQTEESTTIPELQSLAFSQLFTIIEKNSLDPALGTNFEAWLNEHVRINTAIVVGDCTDLCIYQLAMYLRLRANAFDIHDYRVIVPINLVETFDIPEETAKKSGAMAHPGDFFHQVFLYHMALNNIEIVKEIV
jgi:nicotinamidase-related amidase